MLVQSTRSQDGHSFQVDGVLHVKRAISELGTPWGLKCLSYKISEVAVDMLDEGENSKTMKPQDSELTFRKVVLKMLEEALRGIADVKDLGKELEKERANDKNDLVAEINSIAFTIKTVSDLTEAKLSHIALLLYYLCIAVSSIMVCIIVGVLFPPKVVEQKQEAFVVDMGNTLLHVVTFGFFGERLSQKREREEREKQEKLKQMEEEVARKAAEQRRAEMAAARKWKSPEQRRAERREEEERRAMGPKPRQTTFQWFLERNNVGRKW